MFCISDNTVIYRFDDVLFGTGMTVYKDTEAGRELTELFAQRPASNSPILTGASLRFIGANVDDPGTWSGYPDELRVFCEKVVHCARKILLRHMEPAVLLEGMGMFVGRAGQEAIDDQLAKIRKNLGLS